MAIARFQIEDGSVTMTKLDTQYVRVDLSVRFQDADGGVSPYRPFQLRLPASMTGPEKRAHVLDMLTRMTREYDRIARTVVDVTTPAAPSGPQDVTVPDSY